MNRHPATIFVAAALLAVASCGSSVDTADTTSTTAPTSSTASDGSTTTASPEQLTVLVTNDDGIGAPGIDALVTALSAVDGLELVVVAPAANQSGTSDKTTPGGASHADATTMSGVAGTAVDGFPADSVNVALDELGITPDLVVSGINKGQNTGNLAYASGTLGAARTAARRGIPAVAGSAGLDGTPNFDDAASLVVAWIEAHRAALADGTVPVDTITSFNVPTCTSGTMRPEVLKVPLATVIPAGVDPFHSDCTITPATAPADDVAALLAGYPAETLVAIEAP